MKPTPVAILKNSNFRILVATRALTMMALQALGVIVGWQIYSMTGDPFLLGLTGLVEAVPAIGCALFAGYVVDISRPHLVYKACITALMLVSTGLMLVGGGYIEIPENMLLYAIFGGVFMSGLARSFLMPASFTLLPAIVARKDMSAATSWMTTGFQVASVGGPAIAGILYGGYGPRGAWMMPCFLLLLSLVMLIFFKPPKYERENIQKDSAIKSIKLGWQFILTHPNMLAFMVLDMFAVLFGGAVAMLPAFADMILRVGSEGLGALRAAPALGAIITSLVLSLKPLKNISTSLLLWVVAGFGVCMIGFGLSEHFWLSMILLALSGAFDSVSMIIRFTMVQLMTPEHMRGRVSAVNSMFIISSNEIGAFESGVAAKFMGLVPSVVFGGIATLAIVGGMAAGMPKFRKYSIKAE